MRHYIQELRNTLMSNKRNRIWIGSAFLIVLLFLLFYRVPVMEVAGVKEAFLIKEEQFVLGWIHSIEKEEWFESYQRVDEKIVLTETHFKTFGAGTPYQAKVTATEDGFINMELHIDYQELNLTISENVQTTLFFSDREVPLYHYFEQYESVRIKPRNLSIWDYIRGDFL